MAYRIPQRGFSPFMSEVKEGLSGMGLNFRRGELEEAGVLATQRKAETDKNKAQYDHLMKLSENENLTPAQRSEALKNANYLAGLKGASDEFGMTGLTNLQTEQLSSLKSLMDTAKSKGDEKAYSEYAKQYARITGVDYKPVEFGEDWRNKYYKSRYSQLYGSRPGKELVSKEKTFIQDKIKNFDKQISDYKKSMEDVLPEDKYSIQKQIDSLEAQKKKIENLNLLLLKYNYKQPKYWQEYIKAKEGLLEPTQMPEFYDDFDFLDIFNQGDLPIGDKPETFGQPVEKRKPIPGL